MIYYQTIIEGKYSLYDYISLNINILKEAARDKSIISYMASIIYLKDLKEYEKENSPQFPNTYYKVLKIKE